MGNNELTKDEQQLIADFRNLNLDGQKALLYIADAYSNNSSLYRKSANKEVKNNGSY